MTDIDIIRNAIKTLDNLNIPNWLLEQIGIPIYNVNKDLKNLYSAIMERAQQSQQPVPENNLNENPEKENIEEAKEIDN